MNLVSDYLNGPLTKFLTTYGVSQVHRSLVLGDVRHRLESLLRNWSDVSFRRSMVVLSAEEASFWRPQHISVEIRSLVLLAIRNSYIEELHVSSSGRRALITDRAIPELTSGAARFFSQLDWIPFPGSNSDDLFGSLPRRYPRAWAALCEVSKLDGNLERSFDWSVHSSSGADSLPEFHPVSGAKEATVTLSGMSPDFDPQLLDFLAGIQRGEIAVFFTPSFFRVSRNLSKLLAVIDQVLDSGATFLTLNYMLAPGKVARRQSLRRPPHDHDQARAAMSDFEGLAADHESLLRGLT